jgi:ketopantoate hydroxymethyltransferase
MNITGQFQKVRVFLAYDRFVSVLKEMALSLVPSIKSDNVSRQNLPHDLAIPVYEIGAGVEVDGQVMICSDILGIFQVFTPKFVKKYANFGEEILKVMEAYAEEVRAATFPVAQHTYSMVEGELPKLRAALKK